MEEAQPTPSVKRRRTHTGIVPGESYNCVVFSTASGRYFAERLAATLGVPMGETIRKNFGDGESYYRVQLGSHTDLTDKDVVFVSATASDNDFLELIRVGSCLAALATRRRFFVIPFFGFSTMERAVLPGEIVTAKVNARMLSSIPNSGDGNYFMFLDLHVSGILHYFEVAPILFAFPSRW
eukprot:TRINITY_DN2952_c0_g1_i2.p1 TRINITY_DN2952_c0_g1~~TRINITY_DN2952_c0_g1_i2.p1  ORF type:complete len:189 (-),score=36.30 TRINITY_DN2952_c0_g1_i2:569-1111(-)